MVSKVKQSKLVIILLVVLVIFSWGSALLTIDSGTAKEYNGHIELAEEYMQRGLYQKAIEEYDAALSIKSTEEIWTEKLGAYQKRYKENAEAYEDYLSAARSAVLQYDKNADYLLTLANLYLAGEEYTSAYQALNKAVESGLENEKVDALLSEVQYSYEIQWKSYTEYLPCSNGVYAVSETGVWTYIREDGSDADFGQLVFAGPVGDSGIRVIQEQDKAYLIDGEKVPQGILKFSPTASGVYSEGLIAVRDDSSYGYYNSLGDKQFGEYEAAGAFVDGIAAVQKNGEWFLIDSEGKEVSSERYEDIVLQADGSHLKNGVMIAKKDGVYKFYKDDKTVGGYSDVDIVTDDNRIAVCKDGKWGYVDIDGKELIAPQFKEAKSFSNGLAAVSNGEKWGFIDATGRVVIDYLFYGGDYFNSEGCCMVECGQETDGQESAGQESADQESAWQLISLYVK